MIRKVKYNTFRYKLTRLCALQYVYSTVRVLPEPDGRKLFYENFSVYSLVELHEKWYDSYVYIVFETTYIGYNGIFCLFEVVCICGKIDIGLTKRCMSIWIIKGIPIPRIRHLAFPNTSNDISAVMG